MPAASEWFWVLFVAATVWNAASWWVRGAPHRREHPELERGYRSLVGGLLFWGNVPWVVMGAGILFGHVPSIFSYFNIPTGGPWVGAFHGTLLLVWALGTYWLLMRGGAETFVRHPGLFTRAVEDPVVIKGFWLFAVSLGILAMIVAALGVIRVPA